MPNKTKQKPSSLHGVYSKFLQLDMFAQAQSFEVEGERYYRTGMGSLMSCLILMIIAPYVAKRYSVLVNYKDTRYSTSNIENKFIAEHSDMEHGITFEEAQFKMAYGIAVYGEEEPGDGSQLEAGDYEPIWKSYVDVGLKYRYFGFLNETFFNISTEDVPTHTCGDFTEEGFDERDPF